MIDTESRWQRSRRCHSNGCVEVARLDAATEVAVRDSTRPGGPTLRFPKVDWSGFLADIRSERIGSR